MKPRLKRMKSLLLNPCFLILYLNFLPRILSAKAFWVTENDKIRAKRLTVYRSPRKVEDQDLDSLNKVLRSVDEGKAAVESIETVLQSIEEESFFHETRKRSKIAKVLETIEHHTNKALSNSTSFNRSHIEHIRPANVPKSKEGRTVTINTKQGTKKVFIPKGWMFCNVSPVHCYSSKTDKRSVAKRSTKKHNDSPHGPPV